MHLATFITIIVLLHAYFINYILLSSIALGFISNSFTKTFHISRELIVINHPQKKIGRKISCRYIPCDHEILDVTHGFSQSHSSYSIATKKSKIKMHDKTIHDL